jgi:hypothetical protein
MPLTTTQKELLKITNNYTSVKCPIRYDILKSLCNVKSFDSSFNALLRAGYFEAHPTSDYSNQFKRTNKQ